MIAPDPATHPILARHYGGLGPPPNEERRPFERRPGLLLAGGSTRVFYPNLPNAASGAGGRNG